MSSPHDTFFRAVFARRRPAESELRAVLPRQLVAKLDLDTLEVEPPSFVDPALRWRHVDVLYRVRLRGEGEVLIYVLLEHQSTVDPLMPLRVLIYLGRIWDHWLRVEENGGATRIPAVLPIVLHQGPERWSAATELLELIDLEPALLERVRAHLPSFRFLLDDLGQKSPAALRRRRAGPLGTLALLLLREARRERPRLLRVLRHGLELFEALEEEGDAGQVVSYILEVGDASTQDVIDVLGRVRDPKLREAAVTTAEQLRSEGRLEGQRELLLALLNVKFGPLPGELERKVLAGDEGALQRWSVRVVVANSLAEVFADEEA